MSNASLVFLVQLPWFFSLLGRAIFSFLASGLETVWLDPGCLERFVQPFPHCRARSGCIAATLSELSGAVCIGVPEEMGNTMLRPEALLFIKVRFSSRSVPSFLQATVRCELLAACLRSQRAQHLTPAGERVPGAHVHCDSSLLSIRPLFFRTQLWLNPVELPLHPRALPSSPPEHLQP